MSGEERRPGEPDWNGGCRAPAGSECPDCVHQRAFFGYHLVDGAWVR